MSSPGWALSCRKRSAHSLVGVGELFDVPDKAAMATVKHQEEVDHCVLNIFPQSRSRRSSTARSGAIESLSTLNWAFISSTLSSIPAVPTPAALSFATSFSMAASE